MEQRGREPSAATLAPERVLDDAPTPPRARRGLTPFAVALVLAGTLAASFTLLAVRPPSGASAYSQAYNCETFVGRPTCALTAGSWYTITNLGGTNYNVAGDICVQFGQTSSAACALGGYSILLCGNAPVYAYGISETFFGDKDNISGHEDNSTSCE
jgi:hypothetical protein